MARSIEVKIVGDASSLQRAFRQAEGAGDGFSSSMKKLGKYAAAGGAAIAGGLVYGLKKSAESAVEFERSMRNVNTIAKLGERNFKSLGNSVTAMAADVGQKPKVLADGLYDIVSSGFKADDAIKVLAVSAKAATAGMTDTATASKAVTAALNAYGLGADSARATSDILFTTVEKGVLTFEELSQQMGDLVPAAAPLGISLQEVGAGMATLTLQGVPAAEAATRMKNAMLSLAKPTPALTGLLKDQGFASGEAALKSMGFAGVLDMLSTATGGSVAAQAKLTPEIRTLLGVVGLTGKNLETYNANLRAMEDATKGAGSTTKAFAEQSKSLSVQWQKASAAIEVFKVQIGTALIPVLRGALTEVNKFMVKMSEAKGFQAKIKVVFEGLQDLGSKALKIGIDIGEKIGVALGNVKWAAVGNKVSAAIGAALKVAIPKALDLAGTFATGLLRAIDAVDWVVVGRNIGVGIKDGVKKGATAYVKGALGDVIKAGAIPNQIIAKAVGDDVADALTKAFGKKATAGAKSESAKVPGLIKTGLDPAIAVALSQGTSIGSSVKSGIVSGASGVGAALVARIQPEIFSAVAQLKASIKAKSPSGLTRDEIGRPLGLGVVEGFVTGVAPLAASMTRTVQAAVKTAVTSVSGLLSQLTRQEAVWAKFGAALTPLEAQLEKLNQSEERRSQQQAVRDARDELSKARQIKNKQERNAAVTAAEESLRQAELAITTARLGQVAELERVGRDKQVAVAVAAIEKMRAQIAVKTEALNAAFATMGQQLERTFGAKTQQLLTALGNSFDEQIGKVKAWAAELTQGEQAVKAFQQAISQQGPTDSELALTALDKSEEQRGRDLAIQAAEAALLKAQAIVDVTERAAAVAAAEEQMRSAQLAATRARLSEQAAVERAARDAENAERLAALTAQAEAERIARDAQAAARITALETQRAAELMDLQETRRIQGEELAKKLAQLQTHLANHPKAWKKTQAAIVALLKGYGVDYNNSGELLGKAFAAGLKSAEGAVENAAKGLAGAAAAYLKLKSPAEKGPLSTLDSWWKPMGPMLAKQMSVGAIGGAAMGMAAAAPMAMGVGYSGGSSGQPLVVQTVIDGRVVAEAAYPHILVVDKQRGSRMVNHGANVLS